MRESALIILGDRLVATPTGCMEWTGKRGRQGYGEIRLAGKWWKAHRLAFVIAEGPIPKGLFVCHKCDNPPCCNPDHLFLGTQQDNMSDAVSKGRTAKGERAGNNRLTEAMVHEVFERRSRGEPLESIAVALGVNPMTVQAAVKRRTWTHVPVEPALVAQAQAIKRESKVRKKMSRPRLNPEAVRLVFEMNASGKSRREIAERFGMTTANIRAVLMRMTWAHVTIEPQHDPCHPDFLGRVRTEHFYPK